MTASARMRGAVGGAATTDRIDVVVVDGAARRGCKTFRMSFPVDGDGRATARAKAPAHGRPCVPVRLEPGASAGGILLRCIGGVIASAPLSTAAGGTVAGMCEAIVGNMAARGRTATFDRRPFPQDGDDHVAAARLKALAHERSRLAVRFDRRVLAGGVPYRGLGGVPCRLRMAGCRPVFVRGRAGVNA